MSMFCYQCEEAAKGTGCSSSIGVCGKTDVVSALQDLLIYQLKGISQIAEAGRKVNIENASVNKFIMESLFSTITNANFDNEAFNNFISVGFKLRAELTAQVQAAGGDLNNLHDAATFTVEKDNYESKATAVGILATSDADIRSLRELLIYGVKGISAYQEHAFRLGQLNPEIDAFNQKALASTLKDLEVPELIGLVLECGKFGVDVMALLDGANTSTYGSPEITQVNLGVRNNPSILISGHDLKDLKDLLEQTKGTGVDVYTHCEMLPAHSYPEFKKYDNLVGNYGGAWWEQAKEFEAFNGPILMTTNCIVTPKQSYKDRIFTTGVVGFEGVKHIDDAADGSRDYSEIIELAKKCDAPQEIETGEIVGGFAHNQVLSLADKVIDAVKAGAVKKFFVMAGCDGRHKERSYYTDFAKKLPQDAIILTAGCAKFRYNKLDLGDIGGIPRVLDAGQCNDSYSLAVIAMKLQEAFGLEDINELPIAYNIAWYEQKAVIVLLALLHLGVKNIHLGPVLPAFLSENVVNVLVENFGIGGISNVEDDMKMFLGDAV